MTEERRKNGETRKGLDPEASAAPDRRDDQDDDVKIVELGKIDDEDAFLDELSVQLDNLEAEEADPADREVGDEARKPSAPASKPPPEDPADKKTAAPPAPVKAASAAKGSDKAGTPSSSGPVAPARRPASVEAKRPSPDEAGLSASQRRKLEDARMPSAHAARKARQKKTGKGVFIFLILAVLVIGLSAAGGFFLFRPETRSTPREPVKFAVKDAPGIKIEAPPQSLPKEITLEKAEPPAAAANAAAPPAETQPSAAEPPAVEPPPKTPQQTVREFLASWKAAWEASAGKNGRIDPYIAHFSEDFQSRGMDIGAWKADKAAKNRRKEWIRIRIENIRISPPREDGTVAVQFLQSYESSNYSDRTEKSLVLRPEAGKWKIIGFGSPG